MERGGRVDKYSRKKGGLKKVEGGRWNTGKIGRWECRQRVGQVLRGYYYRHASKRKRVSEGLISLMTS